MSAVRADLRPAVGFFVGISMTTNAMKTEQSTGVPQRDARMSPCPCDGQPANLSATINKFDVYKCPSCGLRFVPPEIAAKVDYDELYREGGDYHHHIREAATLAATSATHFPRSRSRVLDSIRGNPPKTAMEIGCGVGSFLYALEQLGVVCHATDMSENAVGKARQYVKAEIEITHFGPDVFPGKTFDAIFMWEVLEHIADVRPLVMEIYRRLEPGGKFYLSTPNYESRLMWTDVDRDPRAIPPVHVTFWTRKSLQVLLGEAGFGQVRIEPCSFPSGAARRSGGKLRVLGAAIEAQLRPSQRRTLVATATK